MIETHLKCNVWWWRTWKKKEKVGAEINHFDTYVQWWAFPELMLLYALMSRGNTQDLTAPSYSFGLVCMYVRVNVSLSVTCLCFGLQVESMDARNACWQKWMYMWDRMRERVSMSNEEVTHWYEQRQQLWVSLPPFFHFYSPMSNCPLLSFTFFFSIPYLHLSLMLFRQPSSIWHSAGLNKRRWLEEWVSELCVTKRRDWMCSCHKRMSFSPSLLCPFS